MNDAEQLDDLRRGREALERLGATVTGYRAPNWDVNGATVGLLGQEGFFYSSNFMDDIRPYRHPGLGLIELPVHWILDDAAHFWYDDDRPSRMATNEQVDLGSGTGRHRSAWRYVRLHVPPAGDRSPGPARPA